MISKQIFSRLYLQVSVIFLLVLVFVTAIAMYISVNAARDYSVELNQRLNRDLASNTVGVIQQLVKDGSINEEAIADIMHSMMVINPSVEVYLLDTKGKILKYVAPDKVVKLKQVSLDPIRKFMSDPEHGIIFGDDPRNPGEYKTFSAAKVNDGETHFGYIYIVLASQEYISAAQVVLNSYILGISVRSVIIILIVSALFGLFAIWFITNKLNVITKGILEFRKGNLTSRIPVKSTGELDRIGLVFNEMADTIESNILELKGVDDLRRELISNVSHDLRTPVASIQGYSETLLLKMDKLSKEEQSKYLNVIYTSCIRLRNLVEELFELSKLESNQVKPNMEAFPITELVYDVINKYRIMTQEKGISINTVIAKEVPMVDADISMIDRVLQNLIDNAVKFCRQGDVINIEIDLMGQKKVQVKVSDSGQGIKQEDLPHIFQRYYKGRSDQNSTGLGLAIVKKIIELHQSEVLVTSQYGKGTTFAFQLPVAALAS